MVRKILCDVCGKEIDPYHVFARLAYKVKIKTRTKTGKETTRLMVRNLDFCSYECYQKFKLKPEALIIQE